MNQFVQKISFIKSDFVTISFSHNCPYSIDFNSVETNGMDFLIFSRDGFVIREWLESGCIGLYIPSQIPQPTNVNIYVSRGT